MTTDLFGAFFSGLGGLFGQQQQPTQVPRLYHPDMPGQEINGPVPPPAMQQQLAQQGLLGGDPMPDAAAAAPTATQRMQAGLGQAAQLLNQSMPRPAAPPAGPGFQRPQIQPVQLTGSQGYQIQRRMPTLGGGGLLD